MATLKTGAASAAYAILSLRLAYYKIYYPEALYKTVLEYELDDAESYLKLSDEELTAKINSLLGGATFDYECGISEEELFLIKEMRARGSKWRRP